MSLTKQVYKPSLVSFSALLLTTNLANNAKQIVDTIVSQDIKNYASITFKLVSLLDCKLQSFVEHQPLAANVACL